MGLKLNLDQGNLFETKVDVVVTDIFDTNVGYDFEDVIKDSQGNAVESEHFIALKSKYKKSRYLIAPKENLEYFIDDNSSNLKLLYGEIFKIVEALKAKSLALSLPNSKIEYIDSYRIVTESINDFLFHNEKYEVRLFIPSSGFIHSRNQLNKVTEYISSNIEPPKPDEPELTNFSLAGEEKYPLVKNVRQGVKCRNVNLAKDNHVGDERIAPVPLSHRLATRPPLRKSKVRLNEEIQTTSLSDIKGIIERNLESDFSSYLFTLIDERGLKDSDVYKKAGITKQVFSRIRSPKYQPTFETAIRLCLSLELNLDDAKDLLGKAGYTLSHCKVRDLVIEYCIKNNIYDIYEVNAYLFENYFVEI